MIFVIEGPDGAGKSTLIQAIRAQAKVRHIQCHFLSSSGPPSSIDRISNELDWLSIAPRTMNLFCDRHRLISEPIYGLTLRNRTLIKPPFNPHPPTSMADVFIYCRPSIDTIRLNLSKNPQLSGVHEHIDQIIEAYDDLFNYLEVHTSFAVMRYDYVNSSRDEFLSAIFDRCIYDIP